MATTDSLTGIMNRRQFFHLGDAEIYRASRYRTPMSIVMLDVDHFKKINDTHGHGVGDECLKALAKCVIVHDPAQRFLRPAGRRGICHSDA